MVNKTDIFLDLSRLAVEMFRGGDAEMMRLDDAEKKQAAICGGLYSDLVSGAVDWIAYKKGANIYTLTRSPLAGYEVQKTCFWDRSGVLLPSSDCKFHSFDGWKKDILPDHVTIFSGLVADSAAMVSAGLD